MISVTELRAGVTYQEDGVLFQVLSYEHVKTGRGSANIKVKVKNLHNGSTVEKGYINGARVQDVMVLKKEVQFLYKDEQNAYFMDPVTYEQISMSLSKIPEHMYLKEGETFIISFLESNPLSLLLPPKMVFTVVETPPGVKGNSATNVFKDAVLDNGMNVKVPLFVDAGDKIRVDTRTGEYSEKAS